jgi:tyrosyl-tRNA synthetase
MKTIIDTLDERGFLHLVTNTGLAAARSRLVCYVGFDPTGPSLHLGHLLPIMALRHFQEAGHGVICVVGGATAQIGDPSGKSVERPLLSVEAITANAASIKMQLARLLDFDGSNAAVLVDNDEWLRDIPLMRFLREVGKHFPVKEMLRKDSVSKRLAAHEQGMSFTEFAYMTLQAYDWLRLHDRFGCTVQMGGSDQWGNIEIGMEYLARVRRVQVHGLTLRLLTTASGAKFGKTAAQGELWLDPRRTSPFALYQFWMNASDEEVIPLLKLFTLLDLKEVEALADEVRRRPEARSAQRRLALESVRLLHGQDAAHAAVRVTELLFGVSPSPLTSVDLALLAREIPTTTLPGSALSLPLADVLVRTKLTPTSTAARTLLRDGGVYLNNRRVADPRATLAPEDFQPGGAVLLRVGSKRNHLLTVEPG